jgi:hypothetical protein
VFVAPKVVKPSGDMTPMAEERSSSTPERISFFEIKSRIYRQADIAGCRVEARSV